MPALKWCVTALERNPVKLVSEALEEEPKGILNCFGDARRRLWRRCKPLTVQWFLYGRNMANGQTEAGGKWMIAYESRFQVVGAVSSELGGQEIVVALTQCTAVAGDSVTDGQESTCPVVCPLAPRC
jgi:hypothetical protein